MSGLRTFGSALCITIGALLLAAWAASWATLDALENGTVIEDATAKSLAGETAQEALVENGTQYVLNALDNAGIDSTTPGIEGITQAILDSVVSSQGFIDLVHAQTKSLRQQIVAELNSDSIGAITVTIDLSAPVNDKLGEVPVIGPSIPEIAVPGIPVQVMDEDTADSARSVWNGLQFAKQWFGWLGLAFVALGILVSHRKRVYFAKVALAVGVISAIVWLVLSAFDSSTLAEWVPGGGAVDAIIIEIANQAKGTVITTMAWVAVGAMMVSLLLFTLARRGMKGDQA
jgi:hypothetical protein